MKGYLLDANVLIALAWPNHTEHERVQEWFAQERGKGWATCVVTQLAFMRVSCNSNLPHHVLPAVAHRYLGEITSLPDHSFWAEPAQGYAHAAFARTLWNASRVSITDAYLATLAMVHGGKLATLDTQLARAFEGVVMV